MALKGVEAQIRQKLREGKRKISSRLVYFYPTSDWFKKG